MSHLADFAVVLMLLVVISLEHVVKCSPGGSNGGNSISQVKLFQSLFLQRRNQHKEAVRSISNLDYARQVKMIQIIAENSFQVLEMSQVRLREAGYIPGMEFPEDEDIREALSKTLENTVFLGEIVLHFPDISKSIVRTNKSWELLLTWGVFFASQSNFLDKNTNKLIYLVSQEMELAERDPDYRNPYSKPKGSTRPADKPDAAQEKKKKKKTFKKGPHLSRQFGDL